MRGEAVATLPFITSSISATPEREGGDLTDSVTVPNLRTIGQAERSVVLPPVMTEAIVTSHAVNAPSISVPETKTKITSAVHPSIFHDWLHGDIFVPQWNVLNDSLLDDSDVSREFVDHLAPPALFSRIRKMDYHHLFTEFNIRTGRQSCLNAEVRMQTEYCLSERRRLESECKKQTDLLKARDGEIENLKAHLLLKEVEATKDVCLRIQVSAVEAAKKERELKDLNVMVSSLKSQNDDLVDQVYTPNLRFFNLIVDMILLFLYVHALEATCFGLRDQVSNYELLKEQIKAFHDAQLKILNDKVAKLDADLLEMALHLEEKFYPHLLTTILGRMWLLTRVLKLYIVKSLHSSAYLTALGAVISRAIERGCKVNYRLRLRNVGFHLLAKLSYHKDASIEDIMNMLRLEGPLADALEMSHLKPDIEQPTLPIHRSEDQVVLGETSLSFALSVANFQVERIKESVATQRSSLANAMVPLVEPLSMENLTSVVGTSDSVLTTGHDCFGDVPSFPTVDFEKEELDTTLKHDPPS
nr:hypothetical protein [Tanacetum cinerariifolium]